MKIFRQLIRLSAVLLCSLPGACASDPGSVLGEAHIIVGFTPAAGGSFTARINGKTFSSPGGFAVTLSSLGAIHELNGSFTGGSLGVTFAASTSTGVETGSVVSVQGPSPNISGCGVIYVAPSTASQQFRIQFKSTAAASLVCT